MVLNTVVVLIMTFLNIILGMYEIRLLIEKYGSAVNGLMQTGNQLMSYVTLLEAGIGASYVYSLYKPVAEQKNAEISSLYTGYKISIRKAVTKMLIFAGLASILYPLLLKNSGIGYGFMVSIFLLQSARKIVPYFITLVPQNMIIVMERRYIVSALNGLSMVITYLAEIVLLRYTNLPLQVLLLICVVIAVASGIIYEVIMRTMYGARLQHNAEPDLTPNKMTRDVMAGNISSMAFNSTDNIVISILGSLSSVTLYSNYNTISNQVTNLISNIINGASASFGLKIAGKDDNTYYSFRELFTGILCAGGIIAAVFIVMINEFITLWFGAKYCLSILNVVMFAYIMYANIVFPILTMMNGAAGLYKESRNFTIFQAVLNLAITITLVPTIGITGALLGTLVARFAVTIPMNYKLIYKYIFKEQKARYLELIAAVLVSGADALLTAWINQFSVIHGIAGILGFIVRSAISTVVITVLVGMFWIVTSKDFRRFLTRIFKMIHRR